MSKKNGHTALPPYISHVRLKGYKSIIDTKVDLHPGLNIIIGPNGSGKTNFLEFLKAVLAVKFPETRFESYLELYVAEIGTIWETRSLSKFELNQNTNEYQRQVEEWIYKKGTAKPIKSNSFFLTEYYNGSKDLFEIIRAFYPISFCPFHLPKDLIGLDSSLSIRISKQHLDADLTLASSAIKFISKFILDNFSPSISKELLLGSAYELLSSLQVDTTVTKNLKKFSPIEDIRLDGGLSIKDNGISHFIERIEFEFLIKEHWLSWRMLSDGTKRLFYLISEVTLTKGICFIEEPELGLYPEQLDILLLFLKEQATNKQIIITTHAPRTLDILKDKELDRIIITKYDTQYGTDMRHLSKNQIDSIIEYTDKEGSTSDLWSMTDFFEDEISLL